MNSSIGSFADIFTNCPYNSLNIFSDATLQAKDGTTFDVHRMVLASKSEYFRAMFSFNEDLKKFQLPNIECNILECILIFLYTDQLSLRLEIVPDLLIACDFLLLDKLSTECCSFVMTHLDIPNCLPILNIAWNLNNRPLFHFCYRFAQLYFQDVVDNSAKQTASLPIEILKMLLAEKCLNMSSEKIVWDTICTWVEFDLPARLQCVPEMLMYLNLEHVEASLASSIISHPIVSNNEHCKTINESKAFLSSLSILKKHMLLHGYPIFPEDQNRMPSLLNAVVTISPSFQSTAIQLFMTFDEKFDACQKISDLEFYPRKSIILDNKLHLFGTNNTDHVVFSWDRVNNVRSSIRQELFLKFSEIFNYYEIAVIPNGTIYCVETDPKDDDLFEEMNSSTVQSYIPELDEWSFVASPRPMYVQNVKSCCGKIYAFGYFFTSQDDLFDYNPVDHNNNDLDDPNNDSGDSDDSNDINPDHPNYNNEDDFNDNCSEFSNNTDLEDRDNDDPDEPIINMLAQVYDPQTDAWSAIALPVKQRTTCSVVNYKNKLLLIGGQDNVHAYKELVDEYDPLTNSWSPKPNLPVRYLDPKPIILDDILYIYENIRDYYNKQYITPPVFWSETYQTWQIVQDSFPFFNFKKFHFCPIDNADTVKKIVNNRRSSEQKWIQNCFI